MIKRNAIRRRIHSRIREKLAGTEVRPRLNVYRSLNHIYAQVIDDQKGETLVSASTLQLKLKSGGSGTAPLPADGFAGAADASGSEPPPARATISGTQWPLQ